MRTDKVSFCGVYLENKKFTPVQYNISRTIKGTLTGKYYADKNGFTPNDKLKKYGYDTVIFPAEKDNVEVKVVKGFKRGVGEEPCTYRDGIFVGKYNKNSLFSYNDIKDAIDKNSDYGCSWWTLSVILFILGGILAKKCTNPHQVAQKVEYQINKPIVKENAKTMSFDFVRMVK